MWLMSTSHSNRLQMSPSATSRHSELVARITKIKISRYTTDCGKDTLVPLKTGWPKSKIVLMAHPSREALLFSLRVTRKCSGMKKTWFSLCISIPNICYSEVFTSENILLENSLRSCVATHQMLTVVSLGSRNVSDFCVLLCI